MGTLYGKTYDCTKHEVDSSMTMIHCGYSRLLIMYINNFEQYFMYIQHFFTRDTRYIFIQAKGTVPSAEQIANNGYK